MNPAFFQSKHQHPSRRALQRAFTLIEVMIVVGIVAILAAIALPSYNEYIIRGHLTNATNSLAGFRADMERHFQDNRTYDSVTSGAVTFPSPCSAASLATLNAGLAAKNVTIACTTWTATTYKAEAAGSGVISGFTYGITHTNVQDTVAAPPGWTINPARWCVRKGC